MLFIFLWLSLQKCLLWTNRIVPGSALPGGMLQPGPGPIPSWVLCRQPCTCLHCSRAALPAQLHPIPPGQLILVLAVDQKWCVCGWIFSNAVSLWFVAWCVLCVVCPQARRVCAWGNFRCRHPFLCWHLLHLWEMELVKNWNIMLQSTSHALDSHLI